MKPTYLPQYNDDGVDMSLIRYCLSLTPLERVRQGERWRQQALRLMDYGRKHRENTARRCS